MSDVETRIVDEILRIARDDLRLDGANLGAEPLASRLDSLALLSLVVAVEDRFRVILTDDDATATRTLEDLARLVAARAASEWLPR